MRKVVAYVLATLGVGVFAFVPAYGQNSNLEGGGSFVNDNVTTDSPGGTSTNSVNVSGDTKTGQQESLLDVIKRFVNYVLALLAFIALLMLLYGGFQILTAAGNDDAVKKGMTIVKNTAIALAFIALAWLVVSIIFFVIGLVTT